MALRVLVVQHAERQRLPGDPGLTDAGHAQAELAAQRLAAEVTVRSIWSSPMRRAQETAGHLAAHLGSTVVVDSRLRERMNWTGLEPIEEFLDSWRRASSDRAHQHRLGDSSLAAAKRFLEVLDDVAAANVEVTVVIVGHGGVTVDALRTLLGDAELRARAPRLIDDGVPCCAITTLSRHDNAWSVGSIAATEHLPQAHGHQPA
ncbi:MAG: histidine phosphatase family protein [Acidimicrobiales bacterium]